MMTSTIASISVFTTSRIESRMKVVLSTGNDSFMPGGNPEASSVALAFTRSRRCQRVRARREFDREAGRRQAVDAADDGIIFRTDLDARHIA